MGTAGPSIYPATPYDKVDFKTLATKDAAFGKIWHQSGRNLDFQDPETCKALTKALLKVDFDLELDLPDDRLCPPVPNRWNYVAWMQALIDTTSPDYRDGYDPERKVVGLDIGTGASAIYTMLLLKTRPNWSMCITDVDEKNFDYAARNLALNKLLARTMMLQTTESMDLIPLKYLSVDKLDFTICNPPFFTTDDEMRASLEGKHKTTTPNAICTGAKVEMVCPGGDLGFAKRILQESLVLKEKVTWYSIMLGKLSSAKTLVGLLKENGISNFAVGCLDPGGATKRWTVAWSFGDLRPRWDVVRPGGGIAHECLPTPTRYTAGFPSKIDVGALSDFLRAHLQRWIFAFAGSRIPKRGLGWCHRMCGIGHIVGSTREEVVR